MIINKEVERDASTKFNLAKAGARHNRKGLLTSVCVIFSWITGNLCGYSRDNVRESIAPIHLYYFVLWKKEEVD